MGGGMFQEEDSKCKGPQVRDHGACKGLKEGHMGRW